MECPANKEIVIISGSTTTVKGSNRSMAPCNLEEADTACSEGLRSGVIYTLFAFSSYFDPSIFLISVLVFSSRHSTETFRSQGLYFFFINMKSIGNRTR